MPFLIFCDNKGCYKQQDALFDTQNNCVVCSECGGVIKNVTSIFKNQLKSSGNILSKRSQKKSFSIKCPDCKVEGQPVLLSNDVLACYSCKKPCQLSPSFATLVLNHLKSNANSQSK